MKLGKPVQWYTRGNLWEQVRKMSAWNASQSARFKAQRIIQYPIELTIQEQIQWVVERQLKDE